MGAAQHRALALVAEPGYRLGHPLLGHPVLVIRWMRRCPRDMFESMSRALRVVGAVTEELVARAEPATRLDTLEAILRFGFAQRPAWDVADVIVQDEFTHDVIVAGLAPAFLVFDTT